MEPNSPSAPALAAQVRNTAVAAIVAVGCVTLLSVLRRPPEAGAGVTLAAANSADVEARQPLRQETE